MPDFIKPFRLFLFCCVALTLVGFVRKKKRGALVTRSTTAEFVRISSERYFNYRQNGSHKILAPQWSFTNRRSNLPNKPAIVLPANPKTEPTVEVLRYISINALNPRRLYPTMILNRPVPFNNNFLRNNILHFGFTVPL